MPAPTCTWASQVVFAGGLGSCHHVLFLWRLGGLLGNRTWSSSLPAQPLHRSELKATPLPFCVGAGPHAWRSSSSGGGSNLHLPVLPDMHCGVKGCRQIGNCTVASVRTAVPFLSDHADKFTRRSQQQTQHPRCCDSWHALNWVPLFIRESNREATARGSCHLAREDWRLYRDVEAGCSICNNGGSSGQDRMCARKKRSR